MTGFIPAREGQCMQMYESPGLPSGDSKPFRVDEEQSTGEEVSETRPERKVREQRALSEEPTRKDATRYTLGVNFLALRWKAEEDKGTKNKGEEAGF